MKLLAIVLASLLALIQYPLWVGHGSWLRVWELDRQLALQQEVNAGKRMRNEGLEAEVADLRGGTQAIEERARYELGMIRDDEIFVQFNAAGTPAGAVGTPVPGVTPGGARSLVPGTTVPGSPVPGNSVPGGRGGRVPAAEAPTGKAVLTGGR